MKKLFLLILIVLITGSVFANDFQGKVYEYKKGPTVYKDCEFQFFEDSLFILNMKEGTYTLFAYHVEGGTLAFEGEESSKVTVPYVLKDGTATLELTIGDEVLVLYDTGRRQYRTNLAFGIVDKTVASSALVAGTVSAYQKTGKFYKTNKYVKSNNGQAPAGYKGGTQFKNYEERLPNTTRNGDAIMYTEYDVNPYVKGVNRGAERLVVDFYGRSYITFDHYQTFYRIN